MSAAAEALQRISEGAAGERATRAAAVALVLRSLRGLVDGEARGFVARRAAAELERLGSSAERGMLERLLLVSAEGLPAERVGDLLVAYGCELERTRRLPECDAVMSLARTLAPESAETALHAGRVARKQGDHARALELYRRARKLDGSGAIGRLASVGEAVVSPDAERALSLVMRAAVRAGGMEVAGVALEERARIRRASGRRAAAARDLCAAAGRFPDAVDRARVAHELADLCIGVGDLAAAREALLVALAVGDASQRDHARSRLHTVARDMGDRVGMRRWRSFERPPLVSLSARPGAAPDGGAPLAPMLSRWRRRILGE